VKRRGLAVVVGELRSIVFALRDETEPAPVGPVLVTGMLAEQLARQLGEGAGPGAVVAGDKSPLPRSSVLVHVIAGDPSTEDDELVRDADMNGVPVILIQLWPQAEWTKPYVLTPFVVECRAGEGFPVGEIAVRIVEAVEGLVDLGRRVPVLHDKVVEAVVGTSMIRAALLATFGKSKRPARPLITLEQVRMLAELRRLDNTAPVSGQDALKDAAPFAVAALAGGFVFRQAASAARRVLPGTITDAAIAAAGTWALGEALRRYSNRVA
jgi:hypothetical protein